MRLIGEGALVNHGAKDRHRSTPDIARTRRGDIDSIGSRGLAAGFAAERLPRESVSELKALQSQINAALDERNYAAALKANKAFHFLIYEGAQMPRLVSMIKDRFRVRIGPSLNDLYPEFATSRVGVSNHMEAMAGLEAGDKARFRLPLRRIFGTAIGDLPVRIPNRNSHRNKFVASNIKTAYSGRIFSSARSLMGIQSSFPEQADSASCRAPVPRRFPARPKVFPTEPHG